VTTEGTPPTRHRHRRRRRRCRTHEERRHPLLAVHAPEVDAQLHATHIPSLERSQSHRAPPLQAMYTEAGVNRTGAELSMLAE